MYCKLYNNDCLEVMRSLNDDFIDLTVTSPPYDNLRNYNGNISQWSFEKFQEIAKELYRITKEGGVVVWVVGDATINGSETGTSFKQALYFKEVGFRLHDTMIYSKNSLPMNHNRYEQILNICLYYLKESQKHLIRLKFLVSIQKNLQQDKILIFLRQTRRIERLGV